MKKEYRKHTERFKREAVRQLEMRGERSAREVAASLGVRENQLYQWRQTYADAADAAREERGETLEEEVQRLRREVVALRKDKEILTKAAAFVAQESER